MLTHAKSPLGIESKSVGARLTIVGEIWTVKTAGVTMDTKTAICAIPVNAVLVGVTEIQVAFINRRAFGERKTMRKLEQLGVLFQKPVDTVVELYNFDIHLLRRHRFSTPCPTVEMQFRVPHKDIVGWRL